MKSKLKTKRLKETKEIGVETVAENNYVKKDLIKSLILSMLAIAAILFIRNLTRG